MKILFVLMIILCTSCATETHPVSYYVCPKDYLYLYKCIKFAKFKTLTACRAMDERCSWYCNETKNSITCIKKESMISETLCLHE